MQRLSSYSESPAHACLLPETIESIDNDMAGIYRRMQPEQRLEIGLELWVSARQILLDALQTFHPEWTPLQVEREAARRMLGESA